MQGFMGGALIPLAFNLILQLLPPSKRVVGFSLFGFASTFAPGIGPSLGGWLTDNFTWISIFYINILPGGIMLAMIAYGMECCPPRWSLLKEGDWWGIATMAVGLGSLTIFLEEGERKDWFGSVLITRLAVIATISLAWFFWHELRVKKPFINLRLIGRRNFGLSCLLNFAVGVALYGSIYLLPVYLAQIQGYSALQIGGVIMWAGLPQLLILPFLNLIQSRFDVRYVVFTGVVIFTISLLMNTVMTHETGLDQLRWSQLLRAIGQPLVMIPITAIATGKIEKEQVGSASGIFNMLRNLGGSVGIALLATMLTQREQFHSVRIGEAVSSWAAPTQDRMTELQQQFFNHGVDAVTAQQQAYALLHQLVQRESYVMAFNECFLLIAATLFLSGALILLCEKPQVQGSVAAH
jgi:DHA2 family multidrug resistance protein